MFKCVQLILFVGGDGVPFTINSLMGYFSRITYCLAPGLAVYTVYGTRIIIFFLVFCNINHP
jgi:hypothetical protein